MNKAFWTRHPVSPDLKCVEMKDRVQGRVMQETGDATSDALVVYFRKASLRFRQELSRVYPESTATPLSVRETGAPLKPSPQKMMPKQEKRKKK